MNAGPALPLTTAPDDGALRYRVEGMDCSACAIKIENAVKRLPGAQAINVNYAAESLSLTLDEGRTGRAVLEERIKALGYTPHLVAGAGAAPTLHGDHGDEREDRPWWRTRKGHLVIATGALLGIAAGISAVRPEWGLWAYLAAALVGLVPFARRAVSGARAGTPFSIETLMSVAVIGAVAIGAAEEAAVVVFLFALGELLENIAAGRARAGIKALLSLVPRSALIEEDGTVKEIPADRLVPGNIVQVRPGDRVPSDGTVLEGRSSVDEAPVTGESVPVLKSEGDTVYAGSINADASLRVTITRAAADNTIARIIHLVEEAQSAKAPTARFIDRFAAWYTPAAMAVSLLVILIPPLLFGAPWMTWVYRGLATLLIACPCALVISTPAAIASALAAGARRGLLIKGGAALETLGKVTAVAFDKTGTLTAGRPQVTDLVTAAGSEDEILAQAAAVESGSSHPLGLAIIAAAKARGLEIPPVFGGSTAVPGKAVTARLRSGFVSVGSPRFAAERAPLPGALAARVDELEGQGKTVVIVMAGENILGAIALRDEPRPDAAQAIAALQHMNIRTLMLTGDNRRTGTAIGNTLGLEVLAELMPDAKLAEIAKLKAQGPVAMVGDGINDAPALAASSVGIAMGGGTDVALETADAALLGSRVGGVIELIELSRATLANIWQNISLALGLKAIFLATTLLGATSLWMAILADTGATVLVTANALRLLRRSRAPRAERTRT